MMPPREPERQQRLGPHSSLPQCRRGGHLTAAAAPVGRSSGAAVDECSVRELSTAATASPAFGDDGGQVKHARDTFICGIAELTPTVVGALGPCQLGSTGHLMQRPSLPVRMQKSHDRRELPVLVQGARVTSGGQWITVNYPRKHTAATARSARSLPHHGR